MGSPDEQDDGRSRVAGCWGCDGGVVGRWSFGYHRSVVLLWGWLLVTILDFWGLEFLNMSGMMGTGVIFTSSYQSNCFGGSIVILYSNQAICIAIHLGEKTADNSE